MFLTSLVLTALASFPVCLTAGEAGNVGVASRLTPLSGIYVNMRIPETAEDLARLTNALAQHPHVTGLLLSMPWKDIEPAEGQYHWQNLDRLLTALGRAGKQYKFKVMPGIYAPEYIYQSGAKRFDTLIANVNRASYGEATVIPVPWDPGYQKHFSRLIRMLGQRYSKDPHCVAVTLSCANYQSAEMHLPKSPQDMAKWKQLGLTAERLLQVYRQYLDEWAAAFPNQMVCLHMSKTTHLEEMEGDAFIEQIVLYGLSRYPRQFSLQSNGLNGRKERDQQASDPLIKFKDRLHNGFQNFASFATNPQRQGSVEMAVLNYIRADAEYWEMGESDGFNAEVCAKLSASLAQARKLGYAAYKQRLIESGQYRRAEDDPWPQLRDQMQKKKDQSSAK